MNTIIDNLLNFNTTNENENKKVINATVERSSPSTVIPSLQQGNRFNQYQDKIKNNVETKLGNSFNNKLGKSVKSIENFTNNVTTGTNQNNENGERLKQEYTQILSEYNETLNKYNALTKKIQKNSSNFIDRTDPNNKYLNSFIQFTRTGHLLYVTKQGVAKYIPNMDILNSISGKNGCPNINGSNKYIAVDIPWLNEYTIEGPQ
jgi:uncharacterized membrane protein YheB (UPF0754 family)